MNYLKEKRYFFSQVDSKPVLLEGMLKEFVCARTPGYYIRCYSFETSIGMLSTDYSQHICFVELPHNAKKILLYNVLPRSYSGGRVAPFALCNAIGNNTKDISPHIIIGLSNQNDTIQVLECSIPEDSNYKYLIYNSCFDDTTFTVY